MAQPTYARIPRNVPHQFNFLGVTPEKFIRVTPTLAGWGAALALGAGFFLSDVPVVRRDVLSQIPVLGAYWNDEEKQE
ncbi:uncharacterized protein VTP21DRAFT_5199 [Calcarisporiella thermophila]|uniref:uncharacterized protein n=1 Tax=Calcarisporiella thermophila TaxID=911321 RepID=UPI003743F887